MSAVLVDSSEWLGKKGVRAWVRWISLHVEISSPTDKIYVIFDIIYLHISFSSQPLPKPILTNFVGIRRNWFFHFGWLKNDTKQTVKISFSSGSLEFSIETRLIFQNEAPHHSLLTMLSLGNLSPEKNNQIFRNCKLNGLRNGTNWKKSLDSHSWADSWTFRIGQRIQQNKCIGWLYSMLLCMCESVSMYVCVWLLPFSFRFISASHDVYMTHTAPIYYMGECRNQLTNEMKE